MYSALTLNRGGNCRLQDDNAKPASCDIRIAASNGGFRAALIALKADGRAAGALVTSASQYDGIVYKRQSEDTIDITIQHASMTGDIQSWLLVLSPTAGGVFNSDYSVTAVISANNLPLAEFTVNGPDIPEAQCLQFLEIYQHPVQGAKCRAHGLGHIHDAASYVAALGLDPKLILEKWLGLSSIRRASSSATPDVLRDLQKAVATPVSPAAVKQPIMEKPVVAVEMPPEKTAPAAVPVDLPPVVPPSTERRQTPPAARADNERRVKNSVEKNADKDIVLDDVTIVQGAIAACCLVMMADGKTDLMERRQSIDAIMMMPAARYLPEFEIKRTMDEQLAILQRRGQAGEAATLAYLQNFCGKRPAAQIIDALKTLAGDQASEQDQQSVARLVALLSKRQVA